MYVNLLVFACRRFVWIFLKYCLFLEYA